MSAIEAGDRPEPGTATAAEIHVVLHSPSLDLGELDPRAPDPVRLYRAFAVSLLAGLLFWAGVAYAALTLLR